MIKLPLILGMHDISATISVSADKCPFFLLSVSARWDNLADIFKPKNNALFPSEALQMCTVCHDGFEMLEIWLESLLKGQNTYVQHVQSKSVIKATSNYNKNITVNDVVESLCVRWVHPQRSYTSITVKFACAFAAVCAIAHSNIVFIWCISIYLLYLI